jgi:L-2-hydroxyglutarate oxidase
MSGLYDLAIIGGGIVGLATAYQFTRRFPGRRVVILEKEARLAAHQSSHNSGVLHSGIYYKPGSLRALYCRAGKQAMIDFCRDEGITVDLCGKVIVAVEETEIPVLQSIQERGKANGVDCLEIDRERLLELEPHAAGIKAIHVPEAGIVDFHLVCSRLAERVRERDGKIVTQAKVIGLSSADGRVHIETTAGAFHSYLAVNCAGLHSDRVAKLGGVTPQAKIVPFRGEYYELKPEARRLCRNLIYPVPDPKFPFLGVHFTRLIDGRVECGPNAVVAFAREGYRKADLAVRDLVETLSYRGFQRMSLSHWKIGLGEMWRSFSKKAFVKALKRLVPELRSEDLDPAPAGVRAQAVSPDGTLLYDFVIEETERVLLVLNATSPAATAALEIGRHLTEKLAPRV